MTASTKRLIGLLAAGGIALMVVFFFSVFGVSTTASEEDRHAVVRAADVQIGPCVEACTTRVRLGGLRNVSCTCHEAAVPGVALAGRTFTAQLQDASTAPSAMLSFKAMKGAAAATYKSTLRAMGATADVVEDPLEGLRGDDAYHAKLMQNGQVIGEMVVVRSGARVQLLVLTGYLADRGRLIAALNERMSTGEEPPSSKEPAH